MTKQPLDVREDGVEVDASIIAQGLGLAPAQLRENMRAGRVTSIYESGADADQGRHRLTFFFGNRRFRLVVDETGTIVQRSTVDFGEHGPRACMP